MLFGKDKVNDSQIDKRYLLEYSVPYLAEVVDGSAITEDCLDLNLHIGQLGRELWYRLTGDSAKKLKQELEIGSPADIKGREFIVYSQTRQRVEGKYGFILDPSKLEEICCIEPITDFPANEKEMKNYQRLVELWQTYCLRSLNSDFGLTEKDMADYFTCKFNLIHNRAFDNRGKPIKELQKKAVNALETIRKFKLLQPAGA